MARTWKFQNDQRFGAVAFPVTRCNSNTFPRGRPRSPVEIEIDDRVQRALTAGDCTYGVRLIGFRGIRCAVSGWELGIGFPCFKDLVGAEQRR